MMSDGGVEGDDLERSIRAARLRSAATGDADLGIDSVHRAGDVPIETPPVRADAPRGVPQGAPPSPGDPAEALRVSAGAMKQTSEEIRRTREKLERRTMAVEQLAETTRRLGKRTASLRSGVLAERRASPRKRGGKGGAGGPDGRDGPGGTGGDAGDDSPAADK